jgi:hypothetical protein
MGYGYMSNATIEEQQAEAQRLFEASAQDARNLQEEIDKQHPLYVQLQAEKAAHAVTASALESALNQNK